MSRFGALLRKAVRRVIGDVYEGPEVPDRYAEMVTTFAVNHPNATVDDWARFSTKLAAGAYRDAFMRALDWARGRAPSSVASAIEDEQRYNFPWYAERHPTMDELRAIVPGDLLDELPTEEAKVAYLANLGLYQGSFRVVVVPPSVAPKPPAP